MTTRSGLAEYADWTAKSIGGRTDVVLVAQSFGGFTAPLVCERVRVDLIVFQNAMIPKPGETFSEWWSNTGQGPAQRAYAQQLGLTPADLEDDRVVYYHDLPDELVEEALRLDADQSSTPLDQPLPLDRLPDVPTRVISGRDDRMFPAAFQRRVAAGTARDHAQTPFPAGTWSRSAIPLGSPSCSTATWPRSSGPA